MLSDFPYFGNFIQLISYPVHVFFGSTFVTRAGPFIMVVVAARVSFVWVVIASLAACSSIFSGGCL